MGDCVSCTIRDGESKLPYQASEYVIELNGRWILNHCGGNSSQTYLGYMILSSEDHVQDIDDLCPTQIETLGMNLKSISNYLKKYWAKNFKDPIQRVHIAYLDEGPFIKGIKLKEIGRVSHVHFHILPRTKGMIPRCDRDRIGWRLVYYIDTFDEYLRNSSHDDKMKLMLYLKRHLNPST